MDIKKVLNLDYRKEENREEIQRVLKQIKPLSKFSDDEEIPLSAIEKAITVMCKKYSMSVRSITPDLFGSDTHTIWRATLVYDHSLKEMATVFGISMYEVFAKIAIRLFAEVKKGIRPRKV